MNLPEKVARLKFEGYLAVRLASAYESLAERVGWKGAERFYSERGLNHIDPLPDIHIERKGFDFDGLMLRREPRETEKVAVKGIAKAQESAKESISKVLLSLREELIEDGLKGIKKLTPATYHELILQPSPKSRQSLRDRLVSTYRQGRRLVASELGKEGKQDEEEEFDELDTLTDVSTARVANDVQSRIIADAARYTLLGLTGVALIEAVRGQIADGSVSYIDRTSTGLANKVINIGRGDEARDRKSDWERVEYSALLDQSVCGPCAAEDGQEADNEDDLTPVPNPDCLGGDWCRCFWVYVQD